MGDRTRASALTGGSGLLVVVGLVALLLAGLLGYITVRDTLGSGDAAAVATDRIVSRAGGYSVEAPEAMTAGQEGRVVQLTSKDKSLVVNIGPGEKGTLGKAQERFLRKLEKRYRSFELLAAEPMQVDGRQAISVSGRATNASKVRIRFVVMVVKAKPRNYTIAAYAAHDSDPADVLPLVNAVANGFEVLPRADR